MTHDNTHSVGVFELSVTARFGECDPAGIVYFPRFYDWFHRAMEDWCTHALEVPYAELLQHHGLPAVHSEADFFAPVAMGERVTVELRVSHLGRSSLRLDYRVLGEDGSKRATGSTTTVLMGTDPTAADHLSAVPFPDDLRGRIQAFMAGR